jgi:hypothetical protein
MMQTSKQPEAPGRRPALNRLKGRWFAAMLGATSLLVPGAPGQAAGEPLRPAAPADVRPAPPAKAAIPVTTMLPRLLPGTLPRFEQAAAPSGLPPGSVLYVPPPAVALPPMHPIGQDIALRNWVKQQWKQGSIPKTRLNVLTVSPAVQGLHQADLYVSVPATNCAGTTHFQPYNGGRDVFISNDVDTRPAELGNYAAMNGPDNYNGVIIHGDTDAAAALDGHWYAIRPKQIAAVQTGIYAVTAMACSKMQHP